MPHGLGPGRPPAGLEPGGHQRQWHTAEPGEALLLRPGDELEGSTSTAWEELSILLQRILNSGLPVIYDQAFPEQRWTTYLLLDSHPNKGQVAITLGLSPRVGPSQALLPIAT